MSRARSVDIVTADNNYLEDYRENISDFAVLDEGAAVSLTTAAVDL